MTTRTRNRIKRLEQDNRSLRRVVTIWKRWANVEDMNIVGYVARLYHNRTGSMTKCMTIARSSQKALRKGR